MREKTLLEKYCRKIHIPYDDSIGNTFGFLSYQLNYQACKLRSEIIKEARKNGNNTIHFCSKFFNRFRS